MANQFSIGNGIKILSHFPFFCVEKVDQVTAEVAHFQRQMIKAESVKMLFNWSAIVLVDFEVEVGWLVIPVANHTQICWKCMMKRPQLVAIDKL